MTTNGETIELDLDAIEARAMVRRYPNELHVLDLVAEVRRLRGVLDIADDLDSLSWTYNDAYLGELADRIRRVAGGLD